MKDDEGSMAAVMVKVSVIIPVYNTERYLKECLDSVTSQTLKDMEILCVDDGSTDGCGRILDGYAESDPRIRVIHKKNGGLVAARKTGVGAATGEYIGYVDSDDWIEPDMYEKMYQTAVGSQAELVSAGYIKEGNYSTAHFDALPEGIYDGERMDVIRENVFYRMDKREAGMRGSLCCKLFDAGLLKKVQPQVPDGISFSEDKLCTLLAVLNCRCVYILKEAGYHYRLHARSMVNAPDAEYLARVNEFYKCVTRLYGQENFTEGMRLQTEIYMTELLVHGINKRLGFRHKNMLWIDPYWLNGIPEGAAVALYGDGEAEEKYRRQLIRRPDIKYAGSVVFSDRELSGNERSEYPGGYPSSALKALSSDYIVITVKNAEKAAQIKKELIRLSVSPERILWFEQKEIFWKYLEAEGLCEGEEKSEADKTDG